MWYGYIVVLPKNQHENPPEKIMSVVKTIENWFAALFYWWRPEVSPQGQVRIYLGEVEAILGIPFGSHGEFQPKCRSNEQIAQGMQRLASMKCEPVPLIAQWEIADTLQEKGVAVIYTAAPKFDPHVSTRQFFQQVRAIRPECKKVALVAHPAHALRAKMTAEKLGFEVSVLWTEDIRYDPKSSQWWCRSAWVFIPWEFASRVLFLLRGWM